MQYCQRYHADSAAYPHCHQHQPIKKEVSVLHTLKDAVADSSRKIGLCCVFGLGLFNILAAVLNRYYNFSNPNSYVFLYW